MTGINLLEPESGDPPVLTRLGTDEMMLCDVIYSLCKTQADVSGISDEDFGLRLGGDAILHAQEAFYEELIDFFRQRGRPDRAKAVEKQRRWIVLAVDKVTTVIEKLDLEAEVERVGAELDQELGELCGSLPELSE
ncbi:MAG: hypothetical protein JXD22_11725 [Sedimentisphaerales bacterium]|nr:hypothetical protein [Sedimentisphaerales bacterium]